MTIEAVIFDIGNVLIEWQPERFFDAQIGKAKREAMFSEVDLHGMNELVDLGHPFTKTVYACADANPKWQTEIRLWHDRWIEMAQPVIGHSVKLMKALQAKQVPVFSLTNFGIDSYDYAATHYPFMREFDRDFISGHMKVTKPSARIYEMVEEASGLSGEQLIFADDRADNIFAASERGWKTHLFEDPQGWADRLVAEGLLTAEGAAA